MSDGFNRFQIVAKAVLAGECALSFDRLAHVHVDFSSDARLLCDEVTRLTTRLREGEPAEGVWRRHAEFLALMFENARTKTTLGILRREGLPLLHGLLEALRAGSSDPPEEALTVLRVLLVYEYPRAADSLIQLLRQGTRCESPRWHDVFVAVGLQRSVATRTRLAKELRSKAPDGVAGAEYLHYLNSVARLDVGASHAFDTHAGRATLKRWLSSESQRDYQAAEAAADALMFVSAPDRERLLTIALGHGSREVRLKGARAAAAAGCEHGVTALRAMCMDRSVSSTAQAYLWELGREKDIPAEAMAPAFQAEAELCEWLLESPEYRRTPDEIETVAEVDLYWPPTDDVRTLWICEFSYRRGVLGETPCHRIGVCGSRTASLPGVSPDMSVLEILAEHYRWEHKRATGEDIPSDKAARILSNANPDLENQ